MSRIAEPMSSDMPSQEHLSPPRLLYVVSEDWYFLSHRLPMARAAQNPQHLDNWIDLCGYGAIAGELAVKS